MFTVLTRAHSLELTTITCGSKKFNSVGQCGSYRGVLWRRTWNSRQVLARDFNSVTGESRKLT
jgi:hypothetical protein